MCLHFVFLQWFFIFFLLATKMHSSGICGPSLESITPKGPSDCVSYSTETDFCCFLNTTDAFAVFSACIQMNKEDVFTVLNLGNMVYTVDCKGIPNYEEHFPFEGEYTACGPQNPEDTDDCWKFNSESTPCCLTNTQSTFTSDQDLHCYFYPKNTQFIAANYTEQNKFGKQLYFACEGSYLSNIIVSLLSVMLILFF